MFARVLTAAATALALAALPAPAHAAAPPLDPDAQILVELRLKQWTLGEEVRGYQLGGGGACLVLPDVIAALDLAIKVDAAAGVAAGWAFTEAQTLRLDRRGGTLQLRGKPQAVPEILDSPEGWCVPTTALAAWLGVEMDVDMANAAVLLRSDVELPVERAMKRRARVARPPVVTLAALPRVKLPYLLFRPPALDATVTANFVRDRKAGTRLDRRYELFGAGELAGMSVDARLASDARGRPGTVRARAYRTDPEARLLGPLRATHVGVGDVSGFASPLVSSGSAGRGATVTNRPVDRREEFDRMRFEGDLPAGWDAELYRNDQLLSFSNDGGNGRYQFRDVPLLFGPNRFAVVLYGPQGQVRREERVVNIGPENLPPGRTYYWAGAAQDGRDLLTLSRPPPDGGRRGWRGALGLEHGLDRLTSLALSVQTLVRDDERLTYLEGAVRRSVGPALVELSAAWVGGGQAFRAQALAQVGGVYVNAESVAARGGFLSDRIERGLIGRHQLALDRSFTAGRVTLPARVEARLTRRRGDVRELEAAARLGASYQNFSLTGGAEWQRVQGAAGEPYERLLLSALGNLRLRSLLLRGEARWRLGGGAGFESASLIGELGIAETGLLRGELGWDAGRKRGRASVGWSHRFPQFALGLTGEAATDGSVAGGFNLSMSLATARGPFRPNVDSMASSGQVLARVFRDLNSDGVRQPGEPAAPEVGITAGLSALGAATDARGQAIVGKLQPHRPVSIGIDETTLADPSIRPKLLRQVVTPRPGVVAVVDIPLVGAGEVEGTLVRDGGAVLEGLALELVDAAGQAVARAGTEFDGYFLFEKVPYGTYRLRIEALSAGAARVGPALTTTVTISEAKPTVSLGAIVAKSSGTTS